MLFRGSLRFILLRDKNFFCLTLLIFQQEMTQLQFAQIFMTLKRHVDNKIK